METERMPDENRAPQFSVRGPGVRETEPAALQAPDEFHLGTFNLDFIPLYMDRRNISI
jgi:hypothetical protein